MNEWSVNGPAHHCAIGPGQMAAKIAKRGAPLGVEVKRVCRTENEPL